MTSDSFLGIDSMLPVTRVSTVYNVREPSVFSPFQMLSLGLFEFGPFKLAVLLLVTVLIGFQSVEKKPLISI